MISLTTAAWVTLAVVTVLSILFMKATVRIAGKGADNGWDNAVAYVVVNGLLLAGVWGYFARNSYFFAALAPLLVWLAQTIAIRTIYEVRTTRAWLIGLLHTLITSSVVAAVGLTVAFVAAYILYGKIISDPMFLIRLLLRLIGIEI